MEDPSRRPGRRGGLWRQRNFRLFWTGESISEVATRAVGFAMMPVGALLAGLLATALGVRAVLDTPT